MKHIILFGDSLFSRMTRNYILQLESLLGDVMVHNCATGGFDTRDGKKRADFIATLHADYVCLSFGANDAGPFSGHPVPLEEFEKNLISIITSFKGSNIILFPCPPVNDPNDVVGTKEYNELLTVYNNTIITVAQKMHVQCIDSVTVYGRLMQAGENYHIEDGLHLNDVGYQMLLHELTNKMQYYTYNQ